MTDIFPQLPDEWSNWKITEKLGEGTYGIVYKAERKLEEVTEFSAIKVIVLSDDESVAMEKNPYNTDSLSEYESWANVYINEIKTMLSLQGITNIVSIQDYLIDKSRDYNWVVFIRMELLTSLQDYQNTKNEELNEDKIIKLGIDICTALSYCDKHKIIHRDIKPENIFITKDGDFKLGDFGVARQLMYSVKSQKGTVKYMAPEVYWHKDTYDCRADIYSLGLVLYTLSNSRNRMPFLDTEKQMINYMEKEAAIVKRMEGVEPVPKPTEASDAFSKIILKAIQADPQKRYQNPDALKKDLEDCLNKKEMPVGGYKEAVITAVSIVIIIAIIGICLLLLSKNKEAEPETVNTTEEIESSVTEIQKETTTSPKETVTATTEEESSTKETKKVKEPESSKKETEKASEKETEKETETVILHNYTAIPGLPGNVNVPSWTEPEAIPQPETTRQSEPVQQPETTRQPEPVQQPETTRQPETVKQPGIIRPTEPPKPDTPVTQPCIDSAGHAAECGTPGVCWKCGLEGENFQISHVMRPYDQGDGTHMHICDCGEKQEYGQNHYYNNGVCICGAVHPCGDAGFEYKIHTYTHDAVCLNCRNTIKSDEPHAFINGVCSICGYSELTPSYLAFSSGSQYEYVYQAAAAGSALSLYAPEIQSSSPNLTYYWYVQISPGDGSPSRYRMAETQSNGLYVTAAYGESYYVEITDNQGNWISAWFDIDVW